VRSCARQLSLHRRGCARTARVRCALSTTASTSTGFEPPADRAAVRRGLSIEPASVVLGVVHS
jgi:hypothetical protein